MNAFLDARAKIAEALALLDTMDEHLVAAHLSMALELLDRRMHALPQPAL